MNQTELHDHLRAAIRAKRGAQAELARRLGISTASVAAFIAGGNRIPPEHVDTILDILGAEVTLQGLTRTGPLTPDNLTFTDPALAGMVASDGQGRLGPMRPADLAAAVLGPIPDHFPEDVRHYLAEGCDCIAYAGFRYSMMTVGASRLALAAEAAVRAYAAQHGVTAGKGHQSMAKLVDALHAAGHFTDPQRDLWTAWKDIRNLLQHPNQEKALSMGSVLPLLRNLHESFLRLFPTPDAPPAAEPNVSP
ncbi:helix-turn-helix domain-containing protein [Deinococcus indicus]|nr:helix-turn-helix transcriptional regulator [Deinococcus indicus]